MRRFVRFTLVRRLFELLSAMLVTFVVGAILALIGFGPKTGDEASILATLLSLFGNAIVAPLLFFSLLLYAPVAAILEALVWVFHKRFTPIVLLIPCTYSLLLLTGLIFIALENSKREPSDDGFLYGLILGTLLFTIAQYVIGREVYAQVVQGFTPSKPRLILTDDAIDPQP